MAKQILNRPDIIARLQEMGGKAVPQGMAIAGLGDPRASNGLLDGPLNNRFSDMMPPFDPASRIDRAFRCRECILPDPTSIRILIFALKRKRQVDRTESGSQIFLMGGFHLFKVALQWQKRLALAVLAHLALLPQSLVGQAPL